tara:strand:+ start:112 stop:648 length:537 start_codon:yes stop_codon:yes gene_type:complete
MSHYFKIIDNFTDSIETNNFYNEFCGAKGKICWEYGNQANKNVPIDSFCTGLSQEELLSVSFLFNTKTKIDKLLNPLNNNFDRIFANGQPNGMDGLLHDDNCLGSLTALLFVNPTWEEWWGGEFLLYDNNELINGATLKPNRLVIFSSHLKHRGLGPTHTVPGLFRVSLAFQYKKNIV